MTVRRPHVADGFWSHAADGLVSGAWPRPTGAMGVGGVAPTYRVGGLSLKMGDGVGGDDLHGR